MRIMVVVSQAVTRQAVAGLEPEMLGQGKARMELVDRREERGRETSMCRRRWRTQATPSRTPKRASRSNSDDARPPSSSWRGCDAGQPGQRTADAHHPVVDQHGDLIGELFLEAQPDQVAAGEFQELRGPGPDSQQVRRRIDRERR